MDLTDEPCRRDKQDDENNDNDRVCRLLSDVRMMLETGKWRETGPMVLPTRKISSTANHTIFLYRHSVFDFWHEVERGLHKYVRA